MMPPLLLLAVQPLLVLSAVLLPRHETNSILLDQSSCPLGWVSASDLCVRLNFNPTTTERAKHECASLGAELVNVIRNQQANKALINDLGELIDKPFASGIAELTWQVGGIDAIQGDSQLSYNLWLSTTGEDKQSKNLALQRKNERQYELLTVSTESSYPFICALTPLTRKALQYEQAMFPRGVPKIVEEPKLAYHYSNRPDGYFVTIPCRAIGNPPPKIKWFKSGIEEVDVDAANSSYIISGGSLLILIEKKFYDSVIYHCSATNVYGTVRSPSTIIRSAFIEPFRRTRLDVYPLNTRGPGTRIECQAPEHYPKSHSFTWMSGGHTDHFVSQNERVFISMDGTLYFSYNKAEDAISYACSLSLPSTQSGHYGPFFNLVLPEALPGPSAAPKIDEFQPQIFPEMPTKGSAVYIECFAFGFPAPKYKWSRVDGESLSPRHRVLNYGRVLKIDSVCAADAVRYKCVAANELGRDSAEIQLLIHSPPVILRPLTDQRTAINSSVTFECLISNNNHAQLSVEWFHDGHPLTPLLMSAEDRRRYKINDHILTILNAVETDTGVYQCIASNDVGSVSSTARLTVENLTPRFHGNIFPRRVFVVEGSHLSIPCLYQASPRGIAHWYVHGSSEPLPVDAHARVRQRKEVVAAEETVSLLEIDDVKKEDEGRYQCETANGIGEGRGATYIKVVPKPDMVVRPASLVSGLSTNLAYTNSPRKITCEVELACESSDDCPEALFDWQFNDRPVRKLVTRDNELKITAREKMVSGFRKQDTVELLRDGQKHKKKRVRQVSEIEVSGTFSSNNIGRFSCSSIYGSGSAELQEPRAISLSPTQVKIVELKRNQLKLSWKQPAVQQRRGFGTNVRMDGYQIEFRTADNRQWRPFPGGQLRTEDRIIGSYLLRNLDPNQKYQFRVRSRTVDGAVSAPSVSTEWVETPQSHPLEPVQHLRWRNIDDNHLLLEWDPLELTHRSGPNLRYNVSWSSPQASTVHHHNADGFAHSELVGQPNIVIPLRITSKRKSKKGKGKEVALKGCYTFAVSVQPLNDVGFGPTATDTVVHVSKEGPQRFADNLLAIPVNSTHLNVTWEWRNLGECENVLGAQIRCIETRPAVRDAIMFAANFSMDQELVSFSHMPVSPTSYESFEEDGTTQAVPAHYTGWLVHGLEAGTEYSCTVRPFDQYGRFGNNSKHAVTARTLDPAPPIAPVITRIKLQEAEGSYATLLEWTAVPLRNSLYNNITDHERGYKILVYVSETAETPITLTMTEAELQNPRKPSAKINGLKLMYFYTIKIAAFNEGGVGPVSEPTSVRLGLTSDISAASAISWSLFLVPASLLLSNLLLP